MSVNLSRAVDAAFRAASKAGLVLPEVVIERDREKDADGLPPAKGTALGREHRLALSRAIQAEAVVYESRGGSWVGATCVLIVAANDLPWLPQHNDRVLTKLWRGRVVERGVIATTGVPLLYELAIGAPAS